jgi:chorismate mutase
MKSLIIVLIALVQIPAFSSDETVSAHYETAQRNCHDIACIRTEINRINTDILKLLAERTAYVQRAGDLKSRTHKIADDRQRVADQEKGLIEQSLALEIPLEITLPTFRAIVENSIKFQQDYIDQMTE